MLIKWLTTVFMQTTHISSLASVQFAFYKTLTWHRERAVVCGNCKQYQFRNKGINPLWKRNSLITSHRYAGCVKNYALESYYSDASLLKRYYLVLSTRYF